MTNKTTMQKWTVCVALIVLLFAFVAIFAVAGLHMPAQTAHAENEYKVLLWLADDPSTPFGSYSTNNNYKSNIKKHYESIDGVTVVEKVYSSGALTEEEISDVQLIFIIAMDANLDNQDGQYVLAASDMIKDFVDAGGRVVLSGENPYYAAPGNAVSSKLAENIGGNFTITSTMGANQEMLLNTTEKPELVKDIVAENFTPIAYAHIESTNPNAVWVMKDSENKVAVLDQAVGNGYITVITDIDWVDCGISDTSDYTNGRNVANRQFLKNLLVASAENIEKNAPHVHNFSYTANGATITATCANAECDLPENKATLTLVAPTGDMVYDGNARVATIQAGYNAEAFPNATIVYYKGDTVVTSCEAAGTYTAKVTFGSATATVTFTIENWTLTDDSDPDAPEKQDVTVEINGAEVDEDVRLKVEVKAEIATEEVQGDYTEAIKEKIADNEEVAIVYEVKLLRLKNVGGQETLEEIQPSDIVGATSITIAMKIPEALKGKDFRILHIHNAGDVSEVNYTVSASGEYISVTTDRLSEFAFLVEKADNGNGTVEGKHGFCIGWIVFIFVMLLLLYTALYLIVWLPQTVKFAIEKCKLGIVKEQREKIVLFGFVNLLLLVGVAASCAVWIFALVALCVHVCGATIASFVLATLILIFFGLILWCEWAKDKKNKNSKTLTSPEEETSTDDEQDTKL